MATFLSPLAARPDAGLVLRNARTGRVVAHRLLPAFESQTRRTGLLKHTSLADGEAMIIAPTNAVHTWFMKFDIDIAFVTRDGRVLKARDTVRPWRMTGAFGGFAVIEMKAGSFASADTVRGDRLEIVEPQPSAG
jgi:uncharacterized membrane protein (UPF0127 family)